MPDFSRWGGNGGDPSLNAIGRTDRYLDALASEQPVYATDPADAELAGLMAGWRDEVRRPPARVASRRGDRAAPCAGLATADPDVDGSCRLGRGVAAVPRRVRCRRLQRGAR